MRTTGALFPDSLMALSDILRTHKSGVTPVAGATDLTISLRNSCKNQQTLVVLGGVPELNEISQDQNEFVIGACVTITRLADLSLPSSLNALTDAAASVGSRQIRNMATIGGNIANASPASDLIPVLILLGADADIMQNDGKIRHQSITELVQGSGKTSLTTNEIITAIHLKKPSGRLISVYEKLGFRERLSISRIGLSITLSLLDNSSIIREARVCIGAVADTTVVDEKAAASMHSQDLFQLDTSALCSALSETVRKTTRTAYKIDAIHGVGLDAIDKLRQRYQHLIS